MSHCQRNSASPSRLATGIARSLGPRGTRQSPQQHGGATGSAAGTSRCHRTRCHPPRGPCLGSWAHPAETGDTATLLPRAEKLRELWRTGDSRCGSATATTEAPVWGSGTEGRPKRRYWAGSLWKGFKAYSVFQRGEGQLPIRCQHFLRGSEPPSTLPSAGHDTAVAQDAPAARAWEGCPGRGTQARPGPASTAGAPCPPRAARSAPRGPGAPHPPGLPRGSSWLCR